jgi:uncharacterized membrane protein YphA (DoxX/SURF4 family)
MFDKKTLNFYSIILGASFIISGIGKLTDTQAFSILLYQYGFGYLMVLAPMIVVIEIGLGLLLILLVNPKRYAWFSFILVLIFTVAFAYGHFKNGINDCGCFGKLQSTGISPIFPFVRNFILLILSLMVWRKYPKDHFGPRSWKWSLISCVMLVVAFTTGLTFKIPVFLSPGANATKSNFRDQNIKNTPLSRYIKTSADSTYLVFCFSYTCPHCWNSIENLRQYDKSKVVDRIITFAEGADSNKRFFMQNFHPDFPIKDLPIGDMLKLTELFPTAFYIKHDTIKAIVEGELPSHVVFKNQYNLYTSR